MLHQINGEICGKCGEFFLELAMKNIRKRDVRKQFLRRQRSFSEGK
ncbi:hypothetical protein QYZ59_13595 [Clostridium perfringens]|nr:hypothetical protein [Clostridium perfringens]MBI6024427.1 hypothetical protein [Clostridium perfringens]MBI6048792.1 hypothetical protein [Clostridium perfringens]MDK0872557.1 hypothetical protein [Clostridium perfringens]MDK0878366.1 hypothetical protein [Clostridium perfringens]MDN4741302.1 hypothetical protein [Clostridium perfringens]